MRVGGRVAVVCRSPPYEHTVKKARFYRRNNNDNSVPLCSFGGRSPSLTGTLS